MDPNDDRRAVLRDAIRRHLRDCPLAGDTPEGIVACWLPRGEFDDARTHIDAVVASMAAAGELLPTPLPDGRVLYFRGPALARE